jgi:hypothetical protein
LLTGAPVASHCPVRCETLCPCLAPGRCQLRGQVGRRAEVHFRPGSGHGRRREASGYCAARKGHFDLGEHAVEAGAQQSGRYRTVDVLDAGVGVQKRPPCEDEMLASVEKKLARRRGLQPCSHRPCEDLARVVVDDGMEKCILPVEQPENHRVHMPCLIGLRGPHADGGSCRMRAQPRPEPTSLTNEPCPGGGRGESSRAQAVRAWRQAR